MGYTDRKHTCEAPSSVSYVGNIIRYVFFILAEEFFWGAPTHRWRDPLHFRGEWLFRCTRRERQMDPNRTGFKWPYHSSRGHLPQIHSGWKGSFYFNSKRHVGSSFKVGRKTLLTKYSPRLQIFTEIFQLEFKEGKNIPKSLQVEVTFWSVILTDLHWISLIFVKMDKWEWCIRFV